MGQAAEMTSISHLENANSFGAITTIKYKVLSMPESNLTGAFQAERKSANRRPEFAESDVSSLDSGTYESEGANAVQGSVHLASHKLGSVGGGTEGGPVIDHRVTRLENDVKHLKRNVDSIVESLPSRSADEHSEHHDNYAEQLKVAREKAAEDKKLKRDLKEKFIKTIVQGIFMAMVAIFLLGLKSQFAEWVNKAVDEKAAEKAHSMYSTEAPSKQSKEPSK